MKRFHFHPEALAEADAAAGFYDERRKGLGVRFVTEMTEAIARIRMNPSIYRKVGSDVRKCRIEYFPYAIVFRARGKEVEIIAVMHLRREPGYWKRRLG